MDKAGSLHPHDLRHAFVTLALDAGVALHRVQDAAGHADPRTTRHYDRARHTRHTACLPRRFRSAIVADGPPPMNPPVRHRSTRDRPAKAPLSEDAVVDAALAILESEGLEAVTMRRVAAALDTGAASLYIYVSGRARACSRRCWITSPPRSSSKPRPRPSSRRRRTRSRRRRRRTHLRANLGDGSTWTGAVAA